MIGTQAFITSAVVLFFHVATVHGDICPKRAIRGFPHDNTAPCYLFERFPTQFVTAERMCRLSGGHLASISDGFVNAFVAHGANEAFLIMEVEDFWIGAQNLENQSEWKWVDGQEWDYTRWDKAQPNNKTMNRCTAMKLIDGRWKSQNCFDRRPYVCELDYIDGNSTTTTMTTQKWQSTTPTEHKTETWMTTLETLAPISTSALFSTTRAGTTAATRPTTEVRTSSATPPTSTTTETQTSTKKHFHSTSTRHTEVPQTSHSILSSTQTPSTIVSSTRVRNRSTTTAATTTTEEPVLIPTCPLNWQYVSKEEGGDDLCYDVIPSVGWLADLKTCEDQNATLVSIHNTAKFLKSLIYHTAGTPGQKDVTIGLKEVVGNGNIRVWKWVDETPVDYENWFDGYPQQPTQEEGLRCATYYTGSPSYAADFGKWKHVPCYTGQSRAVCTQEPIYEPENYQPHSAVIPMSEKNQNLVRGYRSIVVS